MRHHKRKKPTKPDFEYDPSVWQFQLMPVDEMDVEELIAMDAYYSNQAPIGAQPLDCANNDEDIDLPF